MMVQAAHMGMMGKVSMILSYILEWNRSLERPWHKWENNTKMDLTHGMKEQTSITTVQHPVVDSDEHSNEHSGISQGSEFLH